MPRREIGHATTRSLTTKFHLSLGGLPGKFLLATRSPPHDDYARSRLMPLPRPSNSFSHFSAIRRALHSMPDTGFSRYGMPTRAARIIIGFILSKYKMNSHARRHTHEALPHRLLCFIIAGFTTTPPPPLLPIHGHSASPRQEAATDTTPRAALLMRALRSF